jgi:hypothetical protein
LDVEMGGNDAGAVTVGEYLARLLSEVWREGEGFDGKRPFGNSGWEYEVYGALAKAGLIRGDFDEDGYFEDLASDQVAVADEMILDAIYTALSLPAD